MSFDLKKYLANNPLLNEGLSNQEQDIVDDILSVTEGLNDILNKMKGYAKKGLLTLAIVTSVVGQLKAQDQTDLANQVEKASTELVNDKNTHRLGAYGLGINPGGGMYMPTQERSFTTPTGKTYSERYTEWKKSKHQPKPTTIAGTKYKIRLSYSVEEPNLYRVEMISNGKLDPYQSFYFILKKKPNPSSIQSYDPIQSYRDKGYTIKQTTTSGNQRIVIMGDDNFNYVSLHFKGNDLIKTTKQSY